MNRSKHILALAGALSLVAHASANPIPITATPSVIVSTNADRSPEASSSPHGNRSHNTNAPSGFATSSSASGRIGARSAKPDNVSREELKLLRERSAATRREIFHADAAGTFRW